MLHNTSLSAIVMMVVATYVHLVVDNRTLFPLQLEKPIIPTIAIALCLYPLWIGSGSWSLDLRANPARISFVSLKPDQCKRAVVRTLCLRRPAYAPIHVAYHERDVLEPLVVAP
ncbi:MAG: hypothetical protein HYX73_04245 [Acidobacteria bacterium]|nr:hypothetical protein [Acidobacteriota bacterium]